MTKESWIGIVSHCVTQGIFIAAGMAFYVKIEESFHILGALHEMRRVARDNKGRSEGSWAHRMSQTGQ